MQFMYPKRLDKAWQIVDIWIEAHFGEFIENGYVNAPEEVKKALNEIKAWENKNLPKFGN